MSPFKTTLLLAVVLVGLVVYVYTVELPTMEEETVQEIAAARLVSFDDREVIRLTVTSPTDALSLIRDQRYRWHIVDPIHTPADSREVGNVLRGLVVGRVTRVISTNPSDLHQYGLDPPKLTLTLHTKKQSDTIALGDWEPISSSLYALRESDGAVLLTTLSARDFRGKTLLTFRRKEVMPIDRFQVHSLRVQYGPEELVVFQTHSAHGRSGNWRFRSPTEGPADSIAVGTLLMALEDLAAVGFIDSEQEKQQVAQQLGHPTAVLTLQAGNKEYSIRLYQPDPTSGEAYAVRSAQEPIYRIEPDVFHALPREPFDLQDKRLFGMEVSDLAMVKVKTAHQDYVLIQQHQEWVLEEEPSVFLNKHTVKLFVSRLVNLPAEFRVQREETPLDRFGLSTPTAEFIGIDTMGQPRGRLVLGTRAKGLVYVMGSGLPGIYRARSQILTQIPDKQELIVPSQSGS